jgi:uncharacterized membrane protein YeiB
MAKISSSAILKIYLYFISIVTLTAVLFSGAVIFKSAVSYITPVYFSYYLYEANNEEAIQQSIKDGYELEKCYEGEVVEFEGKEYCWDESSKKQDLINSITIFSSMLLLFGLHQLGIKKTKKMETPDWIIKSYNLISLCIYSITGIIAIPIAIYETTSYLLSDGDLTNISGAPAYAIGLVILVLPLWYIFFRKTLNMKD